MIYRRLVSPRALYSLAPFSTNHSSVPLYSARAPTLRRAATASSSSRVSPPHPARYLYMYIYIYIFRVNHVNLQSGEREGSSCEFHRSFFFILCGSFCESFIYAKSSPFTLHTYFFFIIFPSNCIKYSNIQGMYLQARASACLGIFIFLFASLSFLFSILSKALFTRVLSLLFPFSELRSRIASPPNGTPLFRLLLSVAHFFKVKKQSNLIERTEFFFFKKNGMAFAAKYFFFRRVQFKFYY